MSVRYQRTRAGLTTAPRIAAMTVLVRVDRIPAALARRSNETNERASAVYWQTADWLVARGYAQLEYRSAGEFLTLTELGRETAQLCEIGD